MAIANPYQPNANPTSTITTAGTITTNENSWAAVVRVADNSEANIKAVTVSGTVTTSDDFADGRVIIDGTIETVFGGVMFIPSSLTEYHSSKLYIIWLDASTVPQVVRYDVSTGTYVSPSSPGPDSFYRATADAVETQVTSGYIIGECTTDGSGFYVTITPYKVGTPYEQVLSNEVSNAFFSKGTASSELDTAEKLDNWALNNQKTIIDNLAATNALISNLIAGNLQVGPGDGTAASGFRFRVRAYDDSGVALTTPLWDIYYDDTVLMQVICGGTDVGDIIIGDYDGGSGLKWDASSELFTVAGKASINDGAFGNLVLNNLFSGLQQFTTSNTYNELGTFLESVGVPSGGGAFDNNSAIGSSLAIQTKASTLSFRWYKISTTYSVSVYQDSTQILNGSGVSSLSVPLDIYTIYTKPYLFGGIQVGNTNVYLGDSTNPLNYIYTNYLFASGGLGAITLPNASDILTGSGGISLAGSITGGGGLSSGANIIWSNNLTPPIYDSGSSTVSNTSVSIAGSIYPSDNTQSGTPTLAPGIYQFMSSRALRIEMYDGSSWVGAGGGTESLGLVFFSGDVRLRNATAFTATLYYWKL